MDKKEILKQLGDLPEEDYDEFVSIFYEETRGRLRLIAESLSTFDSPAIAKLAHGIKGSSANLRLVQISEIAKSLQEAAQANNQTQVLSSFEQLRSLIPEA